MNKESNSDYKKFGESIEDLNQLKNNLQKPKPEEKIEISKFWILTAVTAGVMFALCNFFIGKASHHAIYSRVVSPIGALLFASVYNFAVTIIQKIQRNRFFVWEDSQFKHPETNGIYWLYVLILLIDAVITFSGGIFIVYAFQFAIYGEVNQGVIASLFSLTSIYIAFISYFAFNEKLHCFHFIGMVLMIACALLIAFSKSAESQDKTIVVYKNVVEVISPVWSVVTAIICTAFFLIRTILIKIYYRKLNINPMKLTIHSYIIQGCVLLIVFLSIEYGPGEVIRDNILAGGFGFMGNVFINHATTKGYTGPAAALANIQVIIQIILDIIFLTQFPNGMQIAACVCGLMGSLCITIGPNIIDKLFGKADQ